MSNTYAISDSTPAEQLPINPTRCSNLIPVAATLSTGYWGNGEIFYQIICETSGNLIVEGKDGAPLYYPAILAGQIIVTVGKRILTSATINGVNVTTSVTGNIWVYGGK